MTYFLHRLRLALMSSRELGVKQVTLYGLYRLALASGLYRRITPLARERSVPTKSAALLRTDLLSLPDRDELSKKASLDRLISEADEICAGKVRLFGGEAVPLSFEGELAPTHWSEFNEENQDIKPIWEAARFCWGLVLARAYFLSKNEGYAQCFWHYTLDFLEANPANSSPHWSSAQEVALRLINLVLCVQVFASSFHSTDERMQSLSLSIAEHAVRIPPTLLYARAQNNNHLISEALGLFTAAAALPTHPKAASWRRIGWKWFNYAIQNQIEPDGTYIQHSTNYHRLMLQAALLAHAIQRRVFPDQGFPTLTQNRLSSATNWLYKLLDPINGQVPNLGPNDGAYILQLSTCPFNDYRPVVASAGIAFLDKKLFKRGPWDEMACWYGLESRGVQEPLRNNKPNDLGKNPIRLVGKKSWAYLRTASFTSRPGHADLLHLDLWWQGLNVAQDAGTYVYTAPYPWDNALTKSFVHNTLTIDNKEQMRRAGRFLYLDWARTIVTNVDHDKDGSWQHICASHNGYRQLRLTHQRSVKVNAQDEWEVIDSVTGVAGKETHSVRIHWLLLDEHYDCFINNEQTELKFRLSTPRGWITLNQSWHTPDQQLDRPKSRWGVIRAGQLLEGDGPVDPTWGWVSPTYGTKVPALALYVNICGKLPLQIISRWSFQ